MYRLREKISCLVRYIVQRLHGASQYNDDQSSAGPVQKHSRFRDADPYIKISEGHCSNTRGLVREEKKKNLWEHAEQTFI